MHWGWGVCRRTTGDHPESAAQVSNAEEAGTPPTRVSSRETTETRIRSPGLPSSPVSIQDARSPDNLSPENLDQVPHSPNSSCCSPGSRPIRADTNPAHAARDREPDNGEGSGHQHQAEAAAAAELPGTRGSVDRSNSADGDRVEGASREHALAEDRIRWHEVLTKRPVRLTEILAAIRSQFVTPKEVRAAILIAYDAL